MNNIPVSLKPCYIATCHNSFIFIPFVHAFVFWALWLTSVSDSTLASVCTCRWLHRGSVQSVLTSKLLEQRNVELLWLPTEIISTPAIVRLEQPRHFYQDRRKVDTQRCIVFKYTSCCKRIHNTVPIHVSRLAQTSFFNFICTISHMNFQLLLL